MYNLKPKLFGANQTPTKNPTTKSQNGQPAFTTQSGYSLLNNKTKTKKPNPNVDKTPMKT